MTTLGVGGVNMNLASIAKSSSQPQIIEEVIIDNLTPEEYVKKYFSDIPVMIEVAKCESRFRQTDKNGDTLVGVVNEFDKGVMQINEMYHEERAGKLGYDLHTIEGNTAYARYLFEKEGLRPWKSSAPCWSKTVAYADYKSDLAMK